MIIFETIISTVNQAGEPHVTPFGVRHEKDLIVISPYKPSTTLENILSTRYAVMNLTDDVRVFAGAIVGKSHPNLVPAQHVAGVRLASSLAHDELELVSIQDDPQRPSLYMRSIYQANHAAFKGFNRAQAAVIELAVLVSRLHMLPREKIEAELNYLQIAIDKTAGANELQAWSWLLEKLTDFYKKE